MPINKNEQKTSLGIKDEATVHNQEWLANAFVCPPSKTAVVGLHTCCPALVSKQPFVLLKMFVSSFLGLNLGHMAL